MKLQLQLSEMSVKSVWSGWKNLVKTLFPHRTNTNEVSTFIIYIKMKNNEDYMHYLIF